MRLLGTDSKERLAYSLKGGEASVLAEILREYPIIPPDYFQVSRTSGIDQVSEEDEQWMKEALRDQQKGNLTMLTELLRGLEGLARTDDEEHEMRWMLSSTEREALLQALNNIRVGHWNRLGRPDTTDSFEGEMSGEAWRSHWVMNICAYFQVALLGNHDIEGHGPE